MSNEVQVTFPHLADAIIASLTPEQRNELVVGSVTSLLAREEGGHRDHRRSKLDFLVEEAVKAVAKKEALRILETPEMQKVIREAVASSIADAESGVASMIHQKISRALSSSF